MNNGTEWECVIHDLSNSKTYSAAKLHMPRTTTSNHFSRQFLQLTEVYPYMGVYVYL